MATVSGDNKALARYALKAFGGSPHVQAYYHDTEALSVDILKCEDRPCKGVTSYSTIGLSDTPMFKDGEEFSVRLELSAACSSVNTQFANVIASAAFCIVRSKRLYHPGATLQGYVREYFASSSVPHLYLTAPFLWESELKMLSLESKKVCWLLAMPISESESQYLGVYGDDALESLFEEHQVDIYDLNRSSVV